MLLMTKFKQMSYVKLSLWPPGALFVRHRYAIITIVFWYVINNSCRPNFIGDLASGSYGWEITSQGFTWTKLHIHDLNS